ncbi:unnamed protein product [Allacma fusca]|uniref:Uncharacterized protein n=1 Tax=Allacma fusca TaxID=39272 RepID=A0A8J2L0N8_9HEXA|nr:unnamed protein product [Allacma fusca]
MGEGPNNEESLHVPPFHARSVYSRYYYYSAYGQADNQTLTGIIKISSKYEQPQPFPLHWNGTVLKS